ncbi:ABC transporter ATP-binding protein [Jannaschia aquimarina]|uniref:PotA_2 protein n=1 Tax=Jannaschia aquimarina TaxID=935700 RepID=A0A0D1EN31_9RHOB|nr:ABC transporter ATP-binding protein [Jannaschia aquimarina]KIT17110.1 Spermidine/putrescine import ATP-binding protein PotA [Jannaschia aquimarina]SNS47047.1 putative spermidine/putrescine transport system ATP-binding protein/spermidine/putrescine transport system ATP-binding protein/putrescine transport system ATP-binding protein [Jannaschia aquimarina]
MIELTGLTKRFGEVVGVDCVDLRVEEGAFVTLLGPSGCGKSTLLRMIGGFEEPTEGTISIDGRDVTDLPPNRRPVNMVFQDYALFPHMSVGRNVAYGLKVSGMARSEAAAEARKALDMVGLADRAEAMPHQLSGGQRQRVALARAIVRHPKVLLLDEPLSALDANLREQMQVELRRLHRLVGLTFIMVTHDQSEALAMSDRIVVMRDGRVVQQAAPSELYDKPADAYVAGFVGTTSFFEGEMTRTGLRAFGQTIRAPKDLAPHGRPARFGYRPEKVELRQGHVADGLTGHVDELLYRGDAVRVFVNVGDGRLAVDLQVTDRAATDGLPRPDEAVTIVIPPARLMAFGPAADKAA